MSLSIPFEADGFPLPAQNGARSLDVTWDKLLWAALTVGRPNRQFLFAHGDASLYEALFRMSLVRMSLEQSGPRGRTLRRTSAARSLDPSEKGAVNYFLGMAVAKLFASDLLAVPWMLHLDVFGPQLRTVLTGRSRPDLIGQDRAGRWVALECKGRISPPNEEAKAKAKAQAQRVRSVDGKAPSFAVGTVTYFRGDTLNFFWRDPEMPTEGPSGFEIATYPGVWNYYYSLVRSLLLVAQPASREGVLWAPVAHLDAEVGVHERIWAALRNNSGQEARAEAMQVGDRLGPCNADGLVVRAGASWTQPLADPWAGDSE